MRAYILTSFILCCVSLFIKLIECGVCDWPRDRKPESLGMHLVGVISSLGFIFWAAIVLWL